MDQAPLPQGPDQFGRERQEGSEQPELHRNRGREGSRCRRRLTLSVSAIGLSSSSPRQLSQKDQKWVRCLHGPGTVGRPERRGCPLQKAARPQELRQSNRCGRPEWCWWQSRPLEPWPALVGADVPALGDVAGVGVDDAVIDGGVEHRAQQPVGLGGDGAAGLTSWWADRVRAGPFRLVQAFLTAAGSRPVAATGILTACARSRATAASFTAMGVRWTAAVWVSMTSPA
jgi:hypothetical protein